MNDTSSEQTAVITGAAGAVGSVAADHFAEAGWQLALLDYGASNLDRLNERHPEALAFDVDLTNGAATRDAIESVHAQHGAVDALLNIAGGFAMQPAAEATSDDLAKMHRINFVTLFNTTRAVLPSMQEAGAGFILGVSAAAGLEGAPKAALYAASKGAVAAYLKSLQGELRDDGIRVSILYPMGVVDTPANRDAMPDADPATWIDRNEIADSLLHAATRGPRGHLRELKVFAPSVD